MFSMTLIAMGKLKEKFYLSAAAEYEKRLKGYCAFQLLELPECRLPEDPSQSEITAGLEKEADVILSKIPKGAWFCVLTPEGKLLSSENLAEKLGEVKLSGKSSAVFCRRQTEFVSDGFPGGAGRFRRQPKPYLALFTVSPG